MDKDYTQNDDGSRSYTFTLTAEQLASDQFLNNMKTGADLFKSWDSQKSMIGKNTIPGADASAEAWKPIYDKIRPADGKYGLDDEKLEKFASENGLNKYQAANIAGYIKDLTTEPAELHDANKLGEMCNAKWGDKAGERVSLINAVMTNAFSDEMNTEFDSLTNQQKMQVVTAIDAILNKFGVKTADFTIGKGGTPSTTTRDRAGYEKEKREMIEKGHFTDLDDKALRNKYHVGYIDIKSAFNL